jgi:hypothetical protein
MRHGFPPAVATWFLKLFLNRVEDESIVGDLLEQYQRGRGWFWYWRQVIGIVGLRLCRKVQRLSVSINSFSIGQAAAVLLFVAVISAVLLSDIWALLLIGIIGGIIAGSLTFLLGNTQTEPPKFNGSGPAPMRHPGISISHIPVEGSAGLLFVFATIFIFVVGIQAIREMVAITAPLAMLALGILAYWHKRHPMKIQGLNLHK